MLVIIKLFAVLCKFCVNMRPHKIFYNAEKRNVICIYSQVNSILGLSKYGVNSINL